ncbi:MAG TPA: GntR family transcriptional regulator [Acidimicrobiales bacterium]|nr:GntR family transcriptional regulator [Acidimicrobiales bacterium]
MIVEIDLDSQVPPYRQVRDRVVALVAEGELAEGFRLPPVRQLAADLGLAANTVARAYRELEQEGVVVTRGRRGTFVRASRADVRPDPGPRLHAAAAAFADQVRTLGVDTPTALQAVSHALAGRRRGVAT